MQFTKKHHVNVTLHAAGAVIYNEQNKILLVEELHPRKKGLWHIPSGTVEQGEFPLEAAEREVFEETGLRIKPTTFLNTYLGQFDDGEYVMRHAWVEPFPSDQNLGPQLTQEIGTIQFFSRSEIDELYKQSKLRMHHTKLMIDDAFRFLENLTSE